MLNNGAEMKKPNLPPNATIILSNNPDGTETIEIAIPFDADLIDLSYPRLFGTVKTVNGTWSAAFTIDFLLLENDSGDYNFEAETYSFQRTQFKSKQAMLNKLTIIYSEYYNKVQQCSFDTNVDENNNAIKYIAEYFDNSIAKLKIVDTNWLIEPNNLYQ